MSQDETTPKLSYRERRRVEAAQRRRAKLLASLSLEVVREWATQRSMVVIGLVAKAPDPVFKEIVAYRLTEERTKDSGHYMASGLTVEPPDDPTGILADLVLRSRTIVALRKAPVLRLEVKAGDHWNRSENRLVLGVVE